MNFVSLSFVIFFVILFGVYWLVTSSPLRRLLMLFASYVFYGWMHPWLAVFLFTYTLVNYVISDGLAAAATSRRLIYWLGVSFNLALLVFFKYFAFIEQATLGTLRSFGIEVTSSEATLFLPLGISFFTLQMISYLTDVYRGNLVRENNFLQFSLYTALFTKLLSGPIERGKNLLPQLTRPAAWSWIRFNEGLYLTVSGYLYKVMIADNVGQVVGKVFTLQKPTLFVLAAGSVAFTLQIYADFAAYTNLARGFGKMLGIDHVENFDSPYLSLTPGDFWQRWHISFSSWLRDYIFYPLRRWILALSVPNIARVIFPTLLTMLVSGIWHGVGWTFVVWGLYYGVLLSLYQFFKVDSRLREARPVVKLLAWMVNFSLIVFGWLIFRSPNLQWLLNSLMDPIYGRSQESLVTGSVILVLTSFYAAPMVINHWLRRLPSAHSTVKAVAYAVALVLLLIFLPLGGVQAQEFIYFNF